jgi:hypothetical protein
MKLVKLFIWILFFIFASCSAQPEKECKYTFWVGGSAISYGVGVVSYKDSGDYFILKRPDSSIVIYPKRHISQININNK